MSFYLLPAPPGAYCSLSNLFSNISIQCQKLEVMSSRAQTIYLQAITVSSYQLSADLLASAFIMAENLHLFKNVKRRREKQPSLCVLVLVVNPPQGNTPFGTLVGTC